MSSSDPPHIKQHFPNISPQTWVHPDDTASLAALQSLSGVNTLLQGLLGTNSDTPFRLIHLASAIRVSERQFPQIYQLIQHACHILDIADIPEVYVSQKPFFDAGALGINVPFIVLNATELESLSEAEHFLIIARELSHCASGHTLYKTLLQVLLKLSVATTQIPMGGAALFSLIAALTEWHRKSELSADRAALLVVQDPTVCYAWLMKLAGGPQAAQLDMNTFLMQAAEYNGAGTPLANLHRLLNLVVLNHPFPVIRLIELQTWVDSGAYASIIAQNYPTRHDASQSTQDDLIGHLKEASEAYREQWETSKDAMGGLISGTFSNIDTVTQEVMRGFGSLLEFATQYKQSDKTTTASMKQPGSTDSTATSEAQSVSTSLEIFTALENLQALREKGILTDTEFDAQKTKLLNRL